MTHAIKSHMGPAEWFSLLALSVLWGGSFFFVEIAVSALAPLTIVFLRVGLAAVALWIFVFATGRRPPRQAQVWLACFGMGTLNNVIPFSLIVWGQTQITSGLASILNATAPLFTVVVAGMLLPDERMTVSKLVGLAIGFAGVVVMIGMPAVKNTDSTILAQMAILGAALSYACAGVFGRRFKSMGVDPITTAAGQVTASAIMLAPVVLVIDGPAHAAGASAGIWAGIWAAVIALALASTAVAYVFYFRILASAGATNILLVTFLVPVSAILLGATILGERLGTVHLLGMAMIGLGLIAIDGRLWRRLTRML